MNRVIKGAATIAALNRLDRLTDVIQHVQSSIAHIPVEVQYLEETSYHDHIRPLIAADYVLTQIVGDLQELHDELQMLCTVKRQHDCGGAK